ncbi:MAG: GNAT family N-acetyltransferase [Limibacillus sp.]
MELTSPRLLFRPGRPGDAQTLPSLLDWEVLKWFDFIHHPYDEAAARCFLLRVAEDHAGLSPGLFLLEEKNSGALIGEAWVVPRQDAVGRSLGYWLAAPHRGQGLGREAVVRMIAYAREDLKAPGLHANVAPQNRRSAALLESLGFVQVGTEPRPESRAGNDHVVRWWLELTKKAGG